MNTLTFRTECDFDNDRVPALLAEIGVDLKEVVVSDGNIFTLLTEHSLETFRQQMKTVIDHDMEYVDLHRCHQTLNTGTEPNNEWYERR